MWKHKENNCLKLLVIKKRFIGPERCFWNSRHRDGRAAWIPDRWGNVTRWPPYPHCLNPVRPVNSLRHTDTPFSACFSFFVDYFCLDDLHINKTGILNSPSVSASGIIRPLMYCLSCEIECINPWCTYLQLLYLPDGLLFLLICSDLLYEFCWFWLEVYSTEYNYGYFWLVLTSVCLIYKLYPQSLSLSLSVCVFTDSKYLYLNFKI